MQLPDRAVLEKLLRGQLSPEVTEQLCRQLETEEHFDRIAAEVMSSDTFIESLKSSVTLNQPPHSPRVQNLIEKFQAWDCPTPEGGTLAGSAESEKKNALRSAKSSAVPNLIGRFRILQKLGQGGMGTVYLGDDPTLNRKVALKVMRPEIASHPEARERFLREARAAAAIEHDNIVAIWDVDEDESSPFIAMPFLQGESLEDRLKREPISPFGVILKLARETAQGLAAAHRRGLIHRDIKPANIWIEGDLKGEKAADVFRRTKILDFGLAHLTSAEVNLTGNGAILGTPAFMSPEQGRGLPVDARSDLFSLGVVLYRMATGEQPFKGNTMMAMLTSLAVDAPPVPNVRNEKIPPLVSDLIMRLMEKEPEERFQTAVEVVTAVQEIVRTLAAKMKGESPALPPVVELQPAPPTKPESLPVVELPPEVIPEPVVTSPRKPARKSPKPLWLGLGGIAILLLGFIIIKITNEDGTVTEIKVPEGSTIEVAQGKQNGSKGKVVNVNGKKIGSKPQADPMDGKTVTVAPRKKFTGPLPETFKNSVGMEFVRVGKGIGWLATNKFNQADRKVEFDNDFYIGKYEVTQEEWQAVKDSNPSGFSRKGFQSKDVEVIKDEDLKRFPVEMVSWNDCQAFLRQLNEREKDTGWVYRLPKQDEWEYACRGGHLADKARSEFSYYFAKGTTQLSLDDANFSQDKKDGLQRSCKVGSYQPNVLGIFDMHGNVWEWCDELSSTEGTSRVIRGGAWNAFAIHCVAMGRSSWPPDTHRNFVGLRLVCVPVE